MTYVTLIREMVNKLNGVHLEEVYKEKQRIHYLTLYYNEDLFYDVYGKNQEELYETLFHDLLKAGIQKYLMIEGIFI